MKKNKVLLIVVLLFTALMLWFTYDMSTRTVKPWDKKKNNVLKKYNPGY